MQLEFAFMDNYPIYCRYTHPTITKCKGQVQGAKGCAIDCMYNEYF
jgi:hypothetical protein